MSGAVTRNGAYAVCISAPRQAELLPIEPPTPAPGQVRVRLEGCGVCASNLPVWEGRPWFKYPLEPGAPGHEAWGYVDALGPEAPQGGPALRRGQRVALLSYHGYAEYDVAPAQAVLPLPPELDTLPFPGEPLGCAMNIFARSGLEAGQTVAIIGIGFLGALLTQLASRAGARVIAISRRPYALALAQECGAAETVVMDDHQRIIHRVQDLTHGRGCERVIEAVGEQWPLDLATALTAERARLIIAGYHQDGPRQVDMQTWNWRGLDVINAHERDPHVYLQGMQAAASAMRDGRLDPRPLLTHCLPLDQLPEAFALMQARPEGFLKAVITP